MFQLTRRIPDPVTHNGDRLSDLLDMLLRFGEPTLYWSKIIGGWMCYVEMRTTTKGSQFKIKSEYHQDPITAVIECRDRIKDALEENNK